MAKDEEAVVMVDKPDLSEDVTVGAVPVDGDGHLAVSL